MMDVLVSGNSDIVNESQDEIVLICENVEMKVLSWILPHSKH